MKKDKQISLRLTTDLNRWLKAEAKRTKDDHIAKVITRAIVYYRGLRENVANVVKVYEQKEAVK